jgi:amidase
MPDQETKVLSPVLAHVTPELGYLSPEVPFPELFQRMTRYVSFTPINNANGSPAISLPMGAATNGLPIGVELSAAHGDERTLLEIADPPHTRPRLTQPPLQPDDCASGTRWTGPNYLSFLIAMLRNMTGSL